MEAAEHEPPPRENQAHFEETLKSVRAANAWKTSALRLPRHHASIHLLRLHPLSVAELGLTKPAELQDLLNLGGFPEPYFSGSDIEARRVAPAMRLLPGLV